MKDFRGKVAAVTGGAEGIGKAIAEAAAGVLAQAVEVSNDAGVEALADAGHQVDTSPECVPASGLGVRPG